MVNVSLANIQKMTVTTQLTVHADS